ncbi:hypothetical protein [Maridesulfovibrio sp.]|uniref:hypothetical protein n=1 Tax=Maridesulfovibrio sp. TaxID=2795000 RepID=UPI002AA8E662|nr:hypothetical protein [Maridesulfovibrio sp.]
MIQAVWQWLGNNSGQFAVLIAVIPPSFGALLYLFQKRQELKNKHFKTYHALVKQLVEGEKDSDLMLDRQLAVVFELRNFSEYYEPSLRILVGLKESWEKNSGRSRLIDEIEETISYIESRRRCRTIFREIVPYAAVASLIAVFLIA